ncbi:MAG: adenylyltransferase/cytidyltransferase family protein [Clostridia bacterium]|nr:adenylyltransferase/cytidyltransferase family protein [Clostridia bacterium]MBR4260476.1 adenylyltransferase/cytidyltransferase family protein [Clostridia bacterium]
MSSKKIGFTIGKFAPFHKGHAYLIETALNEMDEFYVVVYDTPEFNIDIDTKIKWITKKFPTVKILKAYDSPKKIGLDDESVKIQMEYLKEIIKDIDVGYFYSSEEYGKYVAKYLNIENRVVDKERETFPISGTLLRGNRRLQKKWIAK